MIRNKEKNVMCSPEEKEQIVLESYKEGPSKTARKHGISFNAVYCWRRKYSVSGIEGLVSKTGRAIGSKKGDPLLKFQRKKNLTKEEQLEHENLKLKIEVARLKKGTE